MPMRPGTTTRERGPVKIMQLNVLQVAHPASVPGEIDEAELLSLCPRCHQRRQQMHNWSSKSLTQAMKGRLTVTEMQGRMAHLERVRQDALRDGTWPLGALQPGGADLLAAYVLDQDKKPTAANAIKVLPALAAEPIEDIHELTADRNF
jgi:hypothetical protein